MTPGHWLIIPTIHVPDARTSPHIAAAAMYRAAELAEEAGDAANIITSIGAAATQTVFHLHLHLVPRDEEDGLALPWT